MRQEAVVKNPEIVIGLVGPIGVNLEPVIESITQQLSDVNYNSEFIKITEIMREIEIGASPVCDDSFPEYYNSLIAYADSFRNNCESHSALAGLAINEIRLRREKLNKENPEYQSKPGLDMADDPVLGTAYIIRQFKLPQEIERMRATYGRKFIQVSVYMSEEERKKSLISKIKSFNSKKIKNAKCEIDAINLMDIDSNEENEEYGQRVTDVFHLGDVFIHGNEKSNIEQTVKRFVQAFFSNNSISPTRMEYGMYAAAGAALRSIDLSRQVGAAIFSWESEIISLGCNEVPKAFGGTYWGDEIDGAHRDYEEGSDANHNRKVEILHDFLEKLKGLDLLSAEKTKGDEFGELVTSLLLEPSIKESQLMDIIEFGRMVHAEMCAITDAARLGKSIKDSILYCTTFPCHMCAKHIVSSGVKSVVFLEPYPKSYARDLHSDSITFEKSESDKKVHFKPFIGISPRRYRDIFEKKKRKGKDGKTMTWYNSANALPTLEDVSSGYIENEEPSIKVSGLKKVLT